MLECSRRSSNSCLSLGICVSWGIWFWTPPEYFITITFSVTFALRYSANITVHQSMQNLCKWVKYYLLSNQKWLHVKVPVCHYIDRNPQWIFCGEIFLTSLSHWTGHLTYPVYSICGAIQQLVYHQKIMHSDHLQQVLNSCWDVISQELINGAIDQWSKRLLLVVRSQGWHMEDRLRR